MTSFTSLEQALREVPIALKKLGRDVGATREDYFGLTLDDLLFYVERLGDNADFHFAPQFKAGDTTMSEFDIVIRAEDDVRAKLEQILGSSDDQIAGNRPNVTDLPRSNEPGILHTKSVVLATENKGISREAVEKNDDFLRRLRKCYARDAECFHGKQR